MARHMFPGGNTSVGFYSCFDNIIPPYAAGKTIYIKGSSGSGKSTFMKKAGAFLEDLGYAVEYMHCSNDANSLDGIYCPALALAFVDGTAPHTGDPAAPGAPDELLDFTRFIDCEAVGAHTARIAELASEKKNRMEKAYHLLKAAQSLSECAASIYARALDRRALRQKTVSLVRALIPPADAPEGGLDRRLFARAITPFGLKHFLDNLLAQSRLITLYAEHGMGASALLDGIRRCANLAGYNTESFHCPLAPDRPEHLIIPGLSLCLTTANEFHRARRADGEAVDCTLWLNARKLTESRAELQEHKEMRDTLLEACARQLLAANALHHEIEEIYLPLVDFTGLDDLFARTMRRLAPAATGKE